jgi:hypothetical protein
MEEILSVVTFTVFGLYALILVFNLVSRASDLFCKAPGLDLAIFSMTLVPWICAYNYAGWIGVADSIVGQLFVLYSFNLIDERIIHKYQGPKLHQTLNKIVGFTRNHLALLICLLALPIFLAIRVGQILIYPLLRWTLRFPKYKDADWINVSRHKFEGLVGHDMVWCLYCDWMTGLYALAGEMLRNVESFWCPIKFYEGKKCDNCKIDFPDLSQWVNSDGKMEDVEKLLLDKYPPNSDKDRTWYGYKK